MATKKKPTRKPAKKSTKKAVKKAPARAKRAVPVVLSAEARNRLLKARPGAEDLAARIAHVWEERRDLRVPGVTRAGLAALARKLERAAQKERALVDAMERKLRPLSDARALAGDALWRAVLDLYAEVKHRGKRDPSLLEAFGFVADEFKVERASRDDEPAP